MTSKRGEESASPKSEMVFVIELYTLGSSFDAFAPDRNLRK